MNGVFSMANLEGTCTEHGNQILHSSITCATRQTRLHTHTTPHRVCERFHITPYSFESDIAWTASWKPTLAAFKFNKAASKNGGRQERRRRSLQRWINYPALLLFEFQGFSKSSVYEPSASPSPAKNEFAFRDFSNGFRKNLSLAIECVTPSLLQLVKSQWPHRSGRNISSLRCHLTWRPPAPDSRTGHVLFYGRTMTTSSYLLDNLHCSWTVPIFFLVFDVDRHWRHMIYASHGLCFLTSVVITFVNLRLRQ